MKSVLFFILIISTQLLAQTNNKISEAIKSYNLGELDIAKSILIELADDEIQVDSVYYYLGKIFFDEEEYGDAEEYFEEAIELTPNSSEFYLQLGKAYLFDARNSSIFSQMSLASSAKESFIKSLEIDSTNTEARIFYANYLFRAPGIAGGDTDEAILEANKVLKENKKQGHIILANIYSSEEKFDIAENHFKKIEECCSSDKKIFNVFNSYGYLLLNQKRYEEAIEKFSIQVRLAPDNANAYDSLGEAYLAFGNKEKAKEQFLKALEINPNYEPSLEKLEGLND